MVKEGDAGANGCDKCHGWFHGQCVGITADAVSTMGRVRGCFWLCGGCLEGDVFKSEAKFELVTRKHEVLYNFLNDLEILFKITGSTTSNNIPNKDTHSNSTNNEILIDGISEDKGDFRSDVEGEEAKVSEILEYIGESNININQMSRPGKIKFSERRPRSILLRLSSEWDAQKHLAKTVKLKIF